ncbi:hypothetical protein GC170_06770 [bacterium]|nr:hypothetical protein [bacterium]
MFAGIAGGKLVAAGGANFPNHYPWEGGRKLWYDELFVLESPESKSWILLPIPLPLPAGYGISISWNERAYFIGGETGPSRNAMEAVPKCLANVISLGIKDGKFEFRNEPPLPEPLKDATGLVIGSHCYIFGGLSSPTASDASNRLYVLNLTNPDRGWQRAPELPGIGRFQSIAGSDGRSLFVYSGIVAERAPDGSQIRRKPYLREVWRYTPGRSPVAGQWKRLADMPREAAAAPSPAIRTKSGELAILSGAIAADHAKPPEQHPGWSRDILLHDPGQDRWRIARNAIHAGNPVVTAPSVSWKDLDIVISGEISPGRRTPAITTFESEMQDATSIPQSR